MKHITTLWYTHTSEAIAVCAPVSADTELMVNLHCRPTLPIPLKDVKEKSEKFQIAATKELRLSN